MKKLILSVFALTLLSSCDFASSMDANLTNTTSESLSLVLASSIVPTETFQLDSNETILLRDGFSATGSFLEPLFTDYDSIYIKNASNEVVKVFKENSTGKNIYDIERYWLFREPSKRVYEYDYEITNEDIQ